MSVTSEFKAFSKIENIQKLWMTVTQKIHGTNGQILIEPANSEWIPAECGYQDMNVLAGSRTRWLTPNDDNYGFAKWVADNNQELARKLGPGRHYGEWCGPGINNGEGLQDKLFVLFDWWNYADAIADGSYPYLMEGLRIVPVLYKGHYSESKIDEILADLKLNGSKLTPPGGFMNPEGIVIDINGNKYKRVFEQEETAWAARKEPKIPVTDVDVSHLLQPIRLEKLISRDERYSRDYPDCLQAIVTAYIDDLEADGEIIRDDATVRKAFGRLAFPFVRHFMETH